LHAPVQHWPLFAQFPPEATHVGWQLPAVQVASPQQSLATVQLSPNGTQGATQVMPSQLPLQQDADVAQAAPRPLQG